ncbi:hypothetical protein EXE30_13255 [Acinetobacter halotolerans]|uniref:Uncharacterized protein n=1 Tax=Acinetobacter halotolerans TaxID=1752076 RepID=A0A4Q6XED1_9GAMM|nr:hypothetical protein [Acinetobacter halotolerans]RZF50171.1 hypothetical protein EXE30_13255 [Acinetobacter halotolerans]
MNQGIGWHSYFKHWAIAMGLLFITAILCAQLQNHYSEDNLGILVFVLIGVLGLLFSSLFAWLQVETRNSYYSTWLFVGFLSLSLLLSTYLDHTVSIDWAAVSDGDTQLTLYQEIVTSDLTFWMAFIFPFLFSILTYVIRSKLARMKD